MRFVIAAVSVGAILSGCVQSDAAMRSKSPSRQFISDKSADALASCLVPSISANYRGAYGRRDLFVANVRAPGQEYDIVTPNALVDGRYVYLVNVRENNVGSVVSLFEIMPFVAFNRDGLVRGIEPCL